MRPADSSKVKRKLSDILYGKYVNAHSIWMPLSNVCIVTLLTLTLGS